MLRFLSLLAVLVSTSAPQAQDMYSADGQSSVGLSALAAKPFATESDFGSSDVPASFGLSLSAGSGGGVDIAVSVLRTVGEPRQVQTLSGGGSVYVFKRNGFRVGPTLSFQRTTVGSATLTAASLGAVVARQLDFEGGIVVPQLSVAATAVNGGGYQSSGSFALGIVLPAGRARLLIEPALGIGFDGGGGAASLRAGLVASL